VDGVGRVIAGLVDELVADDPVLATGLGLTDGLDAFPSFSPAAVAARVAMARRGLERLEPVAAAGAAEGPPTADVADAAVTIPVLRRVLRRYELRRVHQVLPGFYLDHVAEGLLPLLMRDLVPEDERLRALEARLRAVPDLLEEARANLEPGLPRAYVEKAAGLCEGMQDLAGTTVRDFARDAGRPGALDAASAVAEAALAAFGEHLRERLLPVSVSACGAGRAVLEDVLRFEHMLDASPEQIAALGRRLVAETQGELRELAVSMGHADGDDAVAAVRVAHPGLDGLVPGYREAVEEARAYVVSHELLTLAEGEELVVTATPRCLRGVLPFAAYDPPGPFAERQLGYYYVTPPPPGSSGRELDEALAAHPVASMPTTGVHEAYPGHHVQLTRANRAPTLARRFAGAFNGGTLLVEGWAFYCEEMMERQGFLAAPEVRLMRLNDQVWRACRVVIDAEIATGRMAFTEAVDLLVREARMDRRLAELEVHWYVENPGDPMSYLLGKREVMDLARAFARSRTTSLRAFHDALLDWGSVSPRLIAWGLGLAERPAALGR
jgi:uncharacterized protein (DUF885 family)